MKSLACVCRQSCNGQDSQFFEAPVDDTLKTGAIQTISSTPGAPSSDLVDIADIALLQCKSIASSLRPEEQKQLGKWLVALLGSQDQADLILCLTETHIGSLRGLEGKFTSLFVNSSLHDPETCEVNSNRCSSKPESHNISEKLAGDVVVPEKTDPSQSDIGVESVARQSVEDEFSPPRIAEIVSLVQFSCPTYFCTEAEERVLVDVIRLGDCSGVCSIEFKTIEGSGKAGVRYEHTSGILNFSVGESSKQICVPVLANDAWNGTLDFQIFLSNPVGVELDKYLDNCEVKCIDDDLFPTNKYYDTLLQLKETEIRPRHLMLEYIKMNFQDKVVLNGSIKTFAVDLFENIYFLWKIWLGLFVIDEILTPAVDENEEHTGIVADLGVRVSLYLVGACLCIPFIFVHFLNYRKCYWKVGGASRKRLQENLLRKFLYYDENSRSHVKQSHLVMAMTRDATEIVSDCFMGVFDIVKSMMKLLLTLFLMGSVSPLALIVLVAIPILLNVFLRIRFQKTERAGENQEEHQNKLVEHVHEVVTKYPLIADYDTRGKVIAALEKKIIKLNTAIVQNSAVMVNNEYFAPWLKVLSTAFWIVFGGLLVTGTPPYEDLKISYGVFITTLQVYAAVADEYVFMYRALLKMQAVAPAMYRVTRLMNLPIDLEPRMNITRQTSEFGEAERQKAREEAVRARATYVPADRVQIKFEGMNFNYYLLVNKSQSLKDIQSDEVQSPKQVHAQRTLYRGVAECFGEFEQGKFITIVGPKGDGKATLLKLIAGVILPQEGCVFMPSWLRVLHVGAEPLFLEDSLFANLTLGVNPDDPEDAAMERVLGICEKLKMPETVLAMVRNNEKHHWGVVLSRTQKLLLHFARALITNPDVLVVHHPTLGLDESTSAVVLGLLREFVANKGVLQEKSSQSWHRRRPRTCITSSVHMRGVIPADHVFYVRDHRVREVKKDELEESMLS